MNRFSINKAQECNLDSHDRTHDINKYNLLVATDFGIPFK